MVRLTENMSEEQIGNGLWGIEWSRNRWRHMPWKVNDMIPICLGPSSSKTAGDAIEQQSLVQLLHSLLLVGYPSDSLASCYLFGCVREH